VSNFEIRILKDADSFKCVEDVQRAAWGFEDDANIVPAHFLESINKYCGGLIIGAYLNGQMVGFMLNVATPDKTIQYLHMIGVRPPHQKGGHGVNVGESLFHFYGKEAVKKEVEELRWTFDPLQGQNASLYLHKLGVRVVCYVPDAYGQSAGAGINNDLPTDRLLVSWKANTFPVTPTLREFPPSVTVSGEIGNASEFVLEIPFDINELKKANMDMARDARLNSRAVFTEALSKGYEVIDFVCQKESRRNFYILRRDE